ncbi:receptor-like serine/threonine-protein kinase SD1-7 [Aegilops tauschii subsp. strangulata]|nr:receptor-like serine/threonine-protein kinase SD1-7 [Triticum aestivum]
MSAPTSSLARHRATPRASRIGRCWRRRRRPRPRASVVSFLPPAGRIHILSVAVRPRCGRSPPAPQAEESREAPRVNGVRCVGATRLDCRNGTNTFVLITRGKVPDMTAAVVDFRAILADCAQRCLGGCSCTAYASAKLSGVPWTSTLEVLRVFPNFSRDLYVRLAASHLGGSRPMLSPI